LEARSDPQRALRRPPLPDLEHRMSEVTPTVTLGDFSTSLLVISLFGPVNLLAIVGFFRQRRRVGMRRSAARSLNLPD